MFEPPFAAAKVGIDAATIAAASSVAVSVAATDAANITSFQQASKQVGEMSLNSQLKFVVVFLPRLFEVYVAQCGVRSRRRISDQSRRLGAVVSKYHGCGYPTAVRRKQQQQCPSRAQPQSQPRSNPSSSSYTNTATTNNKGIVFVVMKPIIK